MNEPLRVLLIEGDVTMVERVGRCFAESSELSFEVEHTTHLEKACRIAERHRFDVILAGLRLRDAFGFEIIDQIEKSARVPIIVLGGERDDWLGVQLVRHSAQDFLERELLTERILLRSILFAIERHRREEASRQQADALVAANRRLERLAGTDPLTQVLNRRGLETALREERRFAAHHPPATILVDCDDFKQINDRHGYATGDEVLREIAHRLADCLRRTDSISRVGGDEFLILLPNTSQSDALVIADRAREAVGRRPIDSSTGLVSVTVSISVCTLGGPDASIERALRQLQIGIVESKQIGKDCVSISADLPIIDFEGHLTAAK